MEELQNLRSDSELLESKITSQFINFIKLITKIAVASAGFIYFFYGR